MVRGGLATSRPALSTAGPFPGSGAVPQISSRQLHSQPVMGFVSVVRANGWSQVSRVMGHTGPTQAYFRVWRLGTAVAVPSPYPGRPAAEDPTPCRNGNATQS